MWPLIITSELVCRECDESKEKSLVQHSDGLLSLQREVPVIIIPLCCYWFPHNNHTCSCQPSWNGQDSPGISALVPVVFQLMQNTNNVPEFMWTLRFHWLRWPLKPQAYKSCLVFFNTHKATKTVLRHFLAEKNFRKCFMSQLICCQLVGVAC